MPRYSLECKSCNLSFEKFVDYDELKNLKCETCGCAVSRSFNFSGSKIERSKSEIMEQVKSDAKKIVKKIKSGDQNAISEIYGGEK